MELIEKQSVLTGCINAMQFPNGTTKKELLFDQIDNPPDIKEYYPELTHIQRTFLLTGTTPEEWESMYPPDK